MIQRVQTIYLFLASMALALLFVFPLYTYKEVQADQSVKDVKLTIQGRFEKPSNTGEYILVKPNLPKTIVTVIIGLGLFGSIFLYGNRKRQLRITRVMIIFTFLQVFYFLSSLSNVVTAANVQNAQTGIAVAFPSIAIILTALAGRAIRKDDELVRSADRLR